uniref:Putative secreted protein n=1 Tax=Amblyomma cajennense TaxID=34607 RepID=A0A023FDJ3_AMBCJ
MQFSGTQWALKLLLIAAPLDRSAFNGNLHFAALFITLLPYCQDQTNRDCCDAARLVAFTVTHHDNVCQVMHLSQDVTIHSIRSLSL